MASSGNFAVFSIPLRPESSYSSSDQITGGGLSIKPPSSGSFEPVVATISPNSGKWYWEYRTGQGGGSVYGRPAIATSNQTVVKNEDYNGGQSGQTGVLFTTNNGNKRINGSETSYGNAVSQHDIVQIALDCDNGAVYLGINNTWQNSGDPESGSSKTGAALTSGIQNVDIDILHTRYVGGGIDQYNFGQDDTFGGAITGAGNADGNGHGVFKYAPPSGYLALCSANLPISDDIDPAQTDDDIPTKQFFISQYAGNLTNRTITTENQADLILIRTYDNTQDWYILDSTRGITANKFTLINTNAAESTLPQANFTSVGATSVGISSGTYFNSTGANYQMWMWHCNGGTTTSDSSGDITVTRQTNDAAKFTIATWTGNGVSGSTIAHGLGVKPAMTWIKKRNATAAHGVWHQGYNNGDYDSFGELLGNAAWYANQGANGHFSAAPGTDYLTLTAYSQVNTSSDTYVGYFWADVEGMQKFGKYEGNGNADGPFVYTGFRPRLIFIKNADTGGRYWTVIDTARNTFNLADDIINFDQNIAQYSSSARGVDILSNGFKIRGNDSDNNTSGDTYLYGAWADVPFKYNNTF